MVNVTLREFVLANMVCPHGRRTTVVCLRQAEQRGTDRGGRRWQETAVDDSALEQFDTRKRRTDHAIL